MDARERRSTAGKARGVAWVLAAFVAGLGAPPDAGAGSVFMKNGYIIQGRVVKQTPDEVVLSWPNGSITVANRFIESVVLDPGDRVKPPDEGTAGPKGAAEPRGPRAEVVLPADLDGLIHEISARSRATGAPGPTPVIATTPGGPESARIVAGTPEPKPETPAVSADPRPVPVVTPSVEDRTVLRDVGASDGSFTLRIPEDWSFRELGQGAWQVTGPGAAPGKAARISVVAVEGIERSLAEQIAICRRAEGEFAGLEITRETRREIGLTLGFEAIGTIERDGARFGLRRILVPAGDRAYVIACVSPMPIDPAIESALELCLGEIRFRS